MARPRKYSDEQMIEALRKTKGMVYLAAETIGCEADTIYDRAKVSPAVAASMVRETERSLDVTELQLIKQINEGNTTAMIFYLKTKGKHRGYVERHEFDIRVNQDQADILKRNGLTAAEAWDMLMQELAHANSD